MKDWNTRTILRYVTWVLFKRKLSIFVLLAFTVGCFAFGTFLITPQWEATAKLLVLQDPKQQMILFGDLEAPIPVDSRSSAMDLVEILTGNELAAKIVADFRLDERMRRKATEPETAQEWAKYWLVQVFNCPITLQVKLGLRPEPNPNWLERAIDELIEEMQDIELVEDTSTIYVSIWADDRDLAVDICDAMVDFLLEKTREFDRSEAAKTHEFVSGQLTTVEAALKEAEDDLLEFKHQQNVVELETEKAMLLERFDKLTTDCAGKEAQLAALRAKLDELKAQLGGPAVPGVANIQPAVSTETDRYRGLRNSMNEVEIEGGILDTQVELSEVKGEYEVLQAHLAEVNEELATINAKDLALKRLMRSMSGLHERYMNLRKKQLELEVQKYTETSEFDIKVADRAYIPPRAEVDWPKWGLNLLVGFVFGLVFSIGQAFFFEYWRDTLQHGDDVAESTGLEVLGSVKRVSLKKLCRQLAPGEQALAGVDGSATNEEG